MHFTIPYVEESLESDGKKVQVYKVYLNGAHLCSARYSKFYNLYDDLRSHFGEDEMPYFPPKRFLKLTRSQVNERRDQLEYFLQKVSSSKLNSSIFHKFLKTCQQETKMILPECAVLSIYLLNGVKYDINIQTTDLTKSVLDQLGSYLKLPSKVINKFGLFLVRFHNEREISIIRQLQDFEYPIISLREMESCCKCRIVIRKRIWNIDEETDMLNYSASLDILYGQVCGEIRYNWLKPPADARRDRLNTLIEVGSKRELIQLARSIEFYGYSHLYGQCLTNKPQPNTSVFILIGNNELLFIDMSTNKIIQRIALVCIKSWKICTAAQEILDRMVAKLRNGNNKDGFIEVGDYEQNVNNDDVKNGNCDDSCDDNNKFGASLSFEYMNPESRNLEVIEVKHELSDQIIFLSMSLKSMAEELVVQKSGKDNKNENDNEHQRIMMMENQQSKTTPIIFTPQRSMFYCSNIRDDDL